MIGEHYYKFEGLVKKILALSKRYGEGLYGTELQNLFGEIDCPIGSCQSKFLTQIELNNHLSRFHILDIFKTVLKHKNEILDTHRELKEHILKINSILEDRVKLNKNIGIVDKHCDKELGKLRKKFIKEIKSLALGHEISESLNCQMKIINKQGLRLEQQEKRIKTLESGQTIEQS